MESMEMDDGVGWSRKRRCVRTKEKKKEKIYTKRWGDGEMEVSRKKGRKGETSTQ